MAYLNRAQLQELGFKQLGSNVKISEKSSIYDCEKIEVGDNTRIDDFCVVSGRLKFGRNIYVGPLSLVAGGEEGVVFEDFSTLAYHTQVFTQSDDYLGETMTNPTVPPKFKNENKLAVHIGRHAIIGAGSIVMPGVVVADGCSVGANSLVTKSTEPWGVYVGSPARRIMERKKDLLRLEAEYLKGSDSDPI
jgi:acetyltransferase-like isoleucine patch superfamily enzyme